MPPMSLHSLQHLAPHKCKILEWSPRGVRQDPWAPWEWNVRGAPAITQSVSGDLPRPKRRQRVNWSTPSMPKSQAEQSLVLSGAAGTAGQAGRASVGKPASLPHRADSRVSSSSVAQPKRSWSAAFGALGTDVICGPQVVSLFMPLLEWLCPWGLGGLAKQREPTSLPSERQRDTLCVSVRRDTSSLAVVPAILGCELESSSMCVPVSMTAP